MKKLNKAQKIEKMLSAGATVAEVVEKLKVAKSYVYLVSVKTKVRRTKPTTNDRFHNAVKLTATQTALANKLGIPMGAYARELVTAGSAKIAPATAAWLERNPWFGIDGNIDKTGAALAAHEEVLRSGVAIDSDKYYARIDAQMRKYDKELDKELDITAVGTELGGLVLTSPEKGKYRWVRKDPVDTPDMVNHPPHYKVGGIEVIDFIEAKQLGYNLGNVVKYVSRSGRKGTDAIQDLQKARWYLERAIQRAE